MARQEPPVIHPDELPFAHIFPGKVFVLYVIFCSLVVCALHGMHFALGKDPLAHPLVNGDLISVDSWSLVHVITFGGVGFLFPNQAVVYFLYGAFWEATEYFLTWQNPSLKEFWTERGVNSVWDIWFNLMGYRLGEWLLLKYVMRQRAAKRTNATVKTD